MQDEGVTSSASFALCCRLQTHSTELNLALVEGFSMYGLNKSGSCLRWSSRKTR